MTLKAGDMFNADVQKWSSTMCFAWYVWEHGYEGDPVIRWL